MFLKRKTHPDGTFYVPSARLAGGRGGYAR
jgi:hypothetical protein